MKKIILLVAINAIIITALRAQAPQRFSYQGVARMATGAPLANKAINIRISLHDITVDGKVVYQESQSPVTNIYGLYSVQVGGGVVISGDFNAIDWANGSKFVQMEVDPADGADYTDIGTTELLSVPYALYALNSKPGPQGPPGRANDSITALKQGFTDTAIYDATRAWTKSNFVSDSIINTGIFFEGDSAAMRGGDYNIGWNGNRWRHTGWGNYIFGGNISMPNRMFGLNRLCYIAGYDNTIRGGLADFALTMHSMIDSNANHGTIIGGSFDTIRSGAKCTIVGSQYSVSDSSFTGIYSSRTSKIINNFSAVFGGMYDTVRSHNGIIAGTKTGLLNGAYGGLFAGENLRFSTAYSSNYTVAIGGYANTGARLRSTEYSAMFGKHQDVNGDFSLVYGQNDSTNGSYTVAIGNSSRALANGAWAIADGTGNGVANTVANSYKACFAGGYNLTGGATSVVHISGNSAPPAAVAGPGAGASPFISVTGSDLAGMVTITTGANTIGNKVLATLTFKIPYAGAPFSVISGADAISQGVITNVYTTATTTTLVLNVAAMPLTPATAYRFRYICAQ